MSWPPVVSYQGEPRALVAELAYFGLTVGSLASLPTRAYAPAEAHLQPPLFEPFVDRRATQAVPTPAEVAVKQATSGESWLSASRRAQNALLAWFLVAEDRQRRLVVREVAPLMHQLSLVEHILASTDLQRVLIGDEVGLGKTVEAGLIAQRLLGARPEMRVLYLAPARLVRNVVGEFRRLGLDARRWVAGGQSDARIDSDRMVVASLQKAVREAKSAQLVAAGPWDLLIVDECHHLSDWQPGGGSPNGGYRLVRDLLHAQRSGSGRLLLLSGTPHQGHQARFENILALLRSADEDIDRVAGRVIFRTKESVRDWGGQPLFPRRDVRTPTVCRLSGDWLDWYREVGDLYDGVDTSGAVGARGRAGGWAKGQALQWVASSVEAGLGFLVRLAIRRLRWGAAHPALAEALAALRPYRGGAVDESIVALHARLVKQIGVQEDEEDLEDIDAEAEARWRPDPERLAALLHRGVVLKGMRADAEKWRRMTALLEQADQEKVVLFCQPVETVAVVVREIETAFGERAAVIIGGQSDEERDQQVARFRALHGPRFLVSSRAGGEGINLQVARRLLHLDVPWNPMDLEQRVGRVHRFGSRQTILVDMLVVAGTRETDAYRIARDRLRLIAGQLAPDEFELLFSRVMSLTPPEELADVLSSDARWDVDSALEQRIGAIVREGYQRWSAFTERFADGAKQIGALDPGAAKWEDVRAFLRRLCGGSDAPDGTKPIFSLSDEEVVVQDAAVRTVEVFDQRYVCDETDGLPACDERGAPLPKLGLSDPRVVSALRGQLSEVPEHRIASVRLSRARLPEAPTDATCAILFYAVHRLAIVSGQAEERDLHLMAFVVPEEGSVTPLVPERLGAVVRDVCVAERQTTPKSSLPPRQLIAADEAAVSELRGDPSLDPTGPPIRAIWPVACVLVTLVD